MKNNITAHVVVKNEEKWIWYSLVSVLNHVDEYIIFDTGSTDKTIKIINDFISRYGEQVKINFQKIGSVTVSEFPLLRQQQIEETNTLWFLVLDGDEIWYENSLAEMVQVIRENKYSLIASKFHNCVADIYHYKNFDSDSYNIKGIIGSITIRAYSKNIKGIHCSGDYGLEGYCNDKNIPVQNNYSDIYILDSYYLHTSYLQRSSSLTKDWKIPYRRSKVFAKVEGKVASDFKYPEAFYMDRPSFVESPIYNMSYKYYIYRLLFIVISSPNRAINKIKSLKSKYL
jgi:glycosyltransferase involved in cell wall biosynthesis